MEMGIFCIKIVGNGLILSSGVLLGWYQGLEIQKRYEELQKWKQNILIMYGDVSYGGVTLLEIIQHVIELNIGGYKGFFLYIEERIIECQKTKLEEIWKEGIEKYFCNTHLAQEDKREMLRLGQTLGNVDRKQQLSMLQLHMDKIDYTIKRIETEKEQKIRLYRLLGSLGSLFVIILLM